MKSGHWFGAAIAAALLLPAQAENCGPLRSYGTVKLERLEGSRHVYLPVELGGVPKLMVVDTGAGVSTITSTVAQELKLTANRTDFELYDLTGAKQNTAVTTSIKIGALSGDKIHLMMSPASLDFKDPRVAGLLGADILRNFDVSIDYGANTLTLFDPNHCEGKVVYWPERPIAEIPFRTLGGNAILFTVTLDGHDVKAQLDTGASGSTLEKSKAERTFGLVLGSEDTPVAGDLNGAAGMTTWRHKFKTLSLAGVDVANPEIHIIPDKISDKTNTWSTGSLLDRQAAGGQEPAMLLGANVLNHLHLYIAYKEKTLYITPASTPAEAAPKPN